MGPFIMNPEGVARFFAPRRHGGGSVSRTLRALRDSAGLQPAEPETAAGHQQPGGAGISGRSGAVRQSGAVPACGDHVPAHRAFHYWTKHSRLNAIIQPQQFVEIGEALAKEVGIATGEWVRVSSHRGFIKAVAMVTKRIRPLNVDGRVVHTVGVPLHWGFMGVAKPGFLANTLTPSVGDANSQTPEFKAFLVKVEKI